MKRANKDLYDVSAELEQEFGPVGSEGWNRAIEQAWAEYNAEILLETRKKARMTQAQVAERIGATKSYISRVERGQIVPTATSFFRIPEQKLPFTYSTYGNVSIRDVGFWQGDDSYVTEQGYESGIYADGSCFICAQYYISAGSLGLAMYDYFVAD